MATQRKSGKAAKAAKKPASRVKAKPAPKGRPAPKAKPALKAKPAPKAKPGKPALKASKPAVRAAAAKAAPKPAAKAVPRVVGKPAVKGSPSAKGAPAGKIPPRVIGKPAVKGSPAAKAPLSKLPHKIKPVVKPVVPAPNVKPLGVLPPESRAKGHTGPVPHVNRPLTTTKPTPRPMPSQGAQGVTDKDTKEFEQRLLSERRKILVEMGHLENNVLKVNPRDSAGDLSGYSFHMADAGTDAMEREKAFLFASAEGRLLMDIDAALRRLYNGEYGTCEVCEKPIARARLEAMPYARLCVSCKEKEEKAGRTAGQIGQ